MKKDGDGEIGEGVVVKRVRSLPIRAGVVDTAVGMGRESPERIGSKHAAA